MLIKKWKWAVSMAAGLALLAAAPYASSAGSAQEEATIRIYYGVQAGDTLYGIARKHYLNGDFTSLAKQNGLDPDEKLRVGAQLELNNPLVFDYYTVKNNDTLYGIASRYFSRANYISVLMQYNQLKSAQALKAGMALRIPLPAGEKRHLVQAGETLFSISTVYYKVSDYQNAIARANGMQVAASVIKVGQVLQIPNPFYRAEDASVGLSTSVAAAVLSVEIDLSEHKLDVKSGSKVLKSFSVASGKKGLTPTGTFEIAMKLENPWYSAKGIAGGAANNPLGSRWLGLSVPNTKGEKYGIHGTNAPESIGTNASAGCIRLLNEDVEWLYNLLPMGAKVVIHP